MSLAKEKRTKEQIMRLLDRAIVQEEMLLDKIQWLEIELADCRKKAENPRQELEEQAFPGSKVSFRLDYYRTEKKGPYKGIIEHLPSRERRAFEGDGQHEIGAFVAQFADLNIRQKARTLHPSGLKTGAIFPPEMIDNATDAKTKERSPLLKKLFQEIFSAPGVPRSSSTDSEPPARALQLEAESFCVLTKGQEMHRRTVRKGQEICIQIPVQKLREFLGIPCKVQISAKSLEREPTQSFEAVDYCTPDEEMLILPLKTMPLEQGVYRLSVSMALMSEPNKPYYQENRLLIVQ